MEYPEYKRVCKIAGYYAKLVRDSADNQSNVSIMLGQEYLQDLLNLYEHGCVLDYKRMLRDIKRQQKRPHKNNPRVYEDLDYIFFNLDRSTWRLDKNTPGSPIIPHYLITNKTVRPVGRPKIRDLEDFTSKYKPESKIYSLEEIENTTSNPYSNNLFWTLARRPRLNPKVDKLYISPGVHKDSKEYNVAGYLKTENPWTDRTEQFRWNNHNGE